jgi:hypothetical protein
LFHDEEIDVEIISWVLDMGSSIDREETYHETMDLCYKIKTLMENVMVERN